MAYPTKKKWGVDCLRAQLTEIQITQRTSQARLFHLCFSRVWYFGEIKEMIGVNKIGTPVIWAFQSSPDCRDPALRFLDYFSGEQGKNKGA